MSVITEIKRRAGSGEFAALIKPDGLAALGGDVGGLYLEITKPQFESLQKVAESVPSAQFAVVPANVYFNRLTLLDSQVQDTGKLMLLVERSNLKAIPPIEENILAVLSERTPVDWKLSIGSGGGKSALHFCGTGKDCDGTDFKLETALFSLEYFNPDSLRKEFFRI